MTVVLAVAIGLAGVAMTGRSAPARAAESITVEVFPHPGTGFLTVDVDPDLGADSYRYQLQRLVDGRWQRVGTSFRTQGAAEARSHPVRSGTYRVRTYSQHGFPAAFSNQLDYRAPAADIAVAKVDEGRLSVDVGPDLSGDRSYRIRVLRWNGERYRLYGEYRTRGAAERKTVSVRKGKYRVHVPAQRGLRSTRSAAVKLAGDRQAGMSASEWQMVQLINQVRRSGYRCGSTWYPPVAALRGNRTLTEVAQRHSRDMGRRDFYSHTNPSGQSPFDRMRAAGYRYRSAGENIAAWYPTADQAMKVLLDSPGHCVNIMNGDFREIGVGHAEVSGSRYTHYWTQAFGTR